jgi:tRNA threonylcarbamoyladenosine modification (KEOPS) complex Cgi121 subunit
MSDGMFDSLSSYSNIEVLRADTPEELASMIRQIKQPIKIVAITAGNNRHYAFIIGDIRIRKVNKKNKE